MRAIALLLTGLLWATSVFALGDQFIIRVPASPPPPGGPLTVVPGGEGFGMLTRAAYGCGTNPSILKVTNLDDSGTGSLRAALTASGPRVVIFEKSGTITLDTDITITSPCLTIAGQTAPSPGITLKDSGLRIETHDVLIQHFRIRAGDRIRPIDGGPIINTAGHDAFLTFDNNDEGDVHNIVVDHMSLSWAAGKNAGNFKSNGNITYWRNIISEALYRASNVTFSPGHPSSLGMHWKHQQPSVAIIGNLFAHNSDRNPEIQDTSAVIVNNVIYDWGKDENNYPWATFLFSDEGFNAKASVVGNKYIAGPPPSPLTPLVAIGVWNVGAGSQLYKTDNAIDQTQQAVTAYTVQGFDPEVGTPPVSLSGITLRPSSTIEAFVLANAGARPLDRDTVDTRIVFEVQNRTGGVISSQSAVGGWPTLAENTHSLTPPANPHSVTPSGYTNLEVWLHGFAFGVEP